MGLLFPNQSRDIFRNHQFVASCKTKQENTWICTSQENALRATASLPQRITPIQLNIADVDEKTGRMTGSTKTYAICGTIRRMGESDDCINRLAKKDGIIAKNF